MPRHGKFSRSPQGAKPPQGECAARAHECFRASLDMGRAINVSKCGEGARPRRSQQRVAAALAHRHGQPGQAAPTHRLAFTSRSCVSCACRRLICGRRCSFSTRCQLSNSGSKKPELETCRRGVGVVCVCVCGGGGDGVCGRLGWGGGGGEGGGEWGWGGVGWGEGWGGVGWGVGESAWPQPSADSRHRGNLRGGLQSARHARPPELRRQLAPRAPFLARSIGRGSGRAAPTSAMGMPRWLEPRSTSSHLCVFSLPGAIS